MRAAVMRDRRLVVGEVPAPEPGPGEVLVRTLACGICGSDLHALKHADTFVETARRAGNTFVMDLARDVVMGHEFCAEIVEHGPGTTRALPVGTRVCSRPVLMRATGPQTVGYSNEHPGGYGEYMRLSEELLLEVPNGLSTAHAALTEPMAVGLHAVNKARLQAGESAYVVGCGPVGLAIIAALRLHGVRPVVAADYSPRRRELAVIMGADVVLDPAREEDPERWRTATVIFECVGVPGVIAHIMEAAPRSARIVVVGVCMEPDTIHPLRGISKELALQFVLGYEADEFSTTLTHIAEGKTPVAPLVTGTVPLTGVAQAFEELASPERHAKILVTPGERG